MKYQYNMIPAVLLSALLTGSAKQEQAEPQRTETEQVTESTSIPETTETPAPVLTFAIRTDGVDFLLNGTFLQTLPMEHVPDADEISVCDYDSDGFPDVFLPDWPHSFRGHYYRYDDASGQLVLWDALNSEEGGTGWYMEQNPDGTLRMNEDSIYGSTVTTYEWSQDVLVPVHFLDHYWKSACEVEDAYTYSEEGEKILYCRRLLDYDTGEDIETIENPLYFRITPDAVHVLKGTEIVQEIAVGGFWDGYAALEAYFEQQKLSPTVPLEGAYLREPEQYLGTEDYDFDGYEDLYVPDVMHGNETGTYYRFLPETGQYEPWDALNEIGCDLYTEPESRTLNAFVGGQKQSWQWQDGALVMTETEDFT